MSFIKKLQLFHIFGIALIFIFFLISCDTQSKQGALSVTWTGQATTDLNFSEFSGNDHTLFVRFMPQFPNAYYGPIIAENGSGTFFVGQGDYRDGGNTNNLYVQIGSVSEVYPVTLNAEKWYALAIAGVLSPGGQYTYTLYLNKTPLTPTITVNSSDTDLPVGTLHFGKRTNGQTTHKRNAQFYGLIDDAAIFSKALVQSEINTYSTRGYRFTGNENDLVAAYPFDQPTETEGIHPKLARPVTCFGAAQKILVSSRHSSVRDADALPLPTAQRKMFLPLQPGLEWEVTQSFDDTTISHNGFASFCYDFVLNGYPTGDPYPNGTEGAPFFAAASGDVVTVFDTTSGTACPMNMIEIQQAPNEIAGYLHLQQNSILASAGDTVSRGDELASMGSVCTPFNHLHIAVTDKTDGTPGFVTFPFAFSDYEVKQPDGSWLKVDRGIPQSGQVVRRPLPAALPYNFTAVWCHSDIPEIQIYGATYEEYRMKYDEISPGGWRLHQIRPHIDDNNIVRYTAVWRKSEVIETQVYGYTYEDYRSTYDELWKEGWRIFLLEPYVLNGQVLYTAVWRKQTSPSPELQVYGYSYEDYRESYDELWPEGWRLFLLKPYVFNGEVLYTAIWRPENTPEFQIYGATYEEFRSLYNELWPSGYRLYLIENYRLGNETYYTAAWREGTYSEVQAYEWPYQDYRLKYDDLWPDGWRLSLLDVY